MFVLLKSTWAV